jgi:stage II sporulation protein GA (sporulation sigma-E factor processing peptidase)
LFYLRDGDGLYLDLVITLNVVINFLLLKLAGQVARQKTTLLRLLAGSLIGGMLLLFLPIPAGAQFLMSWPGKFLLPVLMVVLAYRPRHLRDALALILLFYFCSLIMAGLVIFFLLRNNYSVELPLRIFVMPSPSLIHLFWAGLVLLISVQAISPLLREKFLFSHLADEFKVEIELFAKKKKFSAYLDTGNMLKEPFSGLPVAIVSYRSIAELLPQEVCNVLGRGAQLGWVDLEEALLSSAAALKFRLIPYRTLDKDDYLLAFRPEKVTVWQKGRKVALGKGLMVAITQQQFGCGEEFDMLLPFDISYSMGKGGQTA